MLRKQHYSTSCLAVTVLCIDEGMRIIGSSTTEFTLVDYPTMDDRLSNKALKSSGRLKQENHKEQTFKFVQV